jgi:hypothetical protein
VSSQIYDHLCVLKFPLNSKLLGDKDCLHWIWPVKKNDSFSFYLSIAVLLQPPCIFISYCYLCQCQAVCYYYIPVPTKYHWNISFQKKVHRSTFVCCQKCQKCNTICVTTFFYWISMVSQKKKRIKYIQCTPES